MILRLYCFLLIAVPAFAQTAPRLNRDQIIPDQSFSSKTSPEQWRNFERELQEAASSSHPPSLSLEEMNSVALAKLAGSEVAHIRVLNAGPSLRDPDKPPLSTAQDEIEKVWNSIVWEVDPFPLWAEYFYWNVYAAVEYANGVNGFLLTDGWHIAILTATRQIWFTRLAPILENQ